MVPSIKEPVWTVYCHIHIESGRRYVGLTKKTMLKRWNRHVYDATRSRYLTNHFHNSIRKYGKDAFTHEVLETCLTLDGGNSAEQKWVAHFDSRNPQRGFNLTAGGSHTPHPVANAYRSDPEYLEGQRSAAERRWRDPSYRSKTLAATLEALATPDVRQNLSDGVRRAWEDPETREKFEAAARQRGTDPIVREKLRANWDDPDFRERCSAGPRARSAAAAAATHCKRGHEFTPENTALGRDGSRECRACNYARKKAAKSVCPKGHPYSDGNVVLSSSGRRICSVCLAESKAPRPCGKCGGPKDMIISGRRRCRPCTNRRINAWQRNDRASQSSALVM